MSTRVAILDGVRTPFCKSGGVLRDVPADDLGAFVVTELLARTAVDAKAIDEVVIGNVAQPAHAANIGRVISLKAGLPTDTVAYTVHHNCASGMRSLTDAALRISTGGCRLILAGGTESMSAIPLLFGAEMTRFFVRLMRARTVGQRVRTLASVRPSYLKPVIALKLGLTDPVCGLNMGETAEVLAREFGITREEQDAFALSSHRRATAAQEEGRMAEEIAPLVVPPRYTHVQMNDDGPRPDQSEEALAALRPYFERRTGTVTVGNACPVTDGAAAMLLADERTVKDLGVEPLGWLTGWSYAALGGERMGLGPVYATAKLLAETGRKMSDFDLVELNEAFAAQVLANERAFASESFAREHLGRTKALGEIDPERLNVNGGAVALGHPVGATGTRLVLTILREMRRRRVSHGLATLCVGGGQGAALALEAA
ncbi:MAG: thiolase family protein [Planctomycetes bacterium]|nr:thiolase family protein [Planctomycetota bacterium]